MIRTCFEIVAPVADGREIAVVVCAARFQSENMVTVPIIGWRQFARAGMASSLVSRKDARPALRGYRSALVVREWAHCVTR